jgi:hypothetical protein
MGARGLAAPEVVVLTLRCFRGWRLVVLSLRKTKLTVNPNPSSTQQTAMTQGKTGDLPAAPALPPHRSSMQLHPLQSTNNTGTLRIESGVCGDQARNSKGLFP